MFYRKKKSSRAGRRDSQNDQLPFKVLFYNIYKKKKDCCINYLLYFVLTDYNNMFIEREKYVTINIFTKIGK